jgi:hypothetical protein
MKATKAAVAALAGVALYPPAMAIPPNTCLTGYLAPKIRAADLVSAEQILLVDVAEVTNPSAYYCKVKATVLEVEKGDRFSVGQALDFSTRCAGEGSVIQHDDAWLYSDVPVKGKPGRLYYPAYNFVPPGPYFLDIPASDAQALAANKLAGGETPQRLC